MTIFTSIEDSLTKKLPFVAYRKPNSTTINAFFQKNDTLYASSNFEEKGFVFAPFDSKKEPILIPAEHSLFKEEIYSEKRIEKSGNTTEDLAAKDAHLKLVKKGIDAIHNNAFKKVVLSRKEAVKLEKFNSKNIFENLLNTYPNAFVYLWYHPKIGLWLGATPETLVKIKGTDFETMALAGTLPYTTETLNWSQKEIEEQQFVTDYILDKLTPLCSHLHTNPTETVRAGTLLHLKTKIQGSLSSSVSELIRTLHPTPAVCGLPLQASKDFILENELYQRTFYTGFLGEIGIANTSELFVNLRCMELQNNTALLYIGGGITKDSSPEKEWDETVAKAMVMKKVL